MKRKTIIIMGIAALVVLAIVLWCVLSTEKEIKVSTVTVQEQTVEITVTATGYVQPVDKVDVGTQVSGVIEKIFVDYNSHVKKGQLLAELDKSTLREKLSQASATLLSAQSDLTFSQQNYDRVKQLYDAKAATQAALETATNQLTQARTSVTNAQANVYQAKVNLSYAEIYSPIDGIVLARSVEQGQTVAASFSTPTLFTIANDLKKMQVEAAVDEADIGRVSIGRPVNFTVDAYSDDIFRGTVNQIRLQPVVTSNVVTYTVIIEAPNPEEKLFPGMTANITIVTESGSGLTVPVEALRFNPSPEVMSRLKIKPVPSDTAREKAVWVQTETETLRKKIKTGLNDGVTAIVTEGLNRGDVVILSAQMEKKDRKNEAAAKNPLMPQRPGGNKR